MAAPLKIGADIPDLRELRRDLESVRLGLGRSLAKAKQRAARRLVAPTKARTPWGPGPRRDAVNANDRLPHIRDTISASASGIQARHPAALVTEFGGTISPNGADIRIKASEMAQGAAAASGSEVERVMRDEIERLLSRVS